MMKPENYLRLKTVCQIVAFSPASIYRKVKTREFPEPVRIGKTSRWREADIAAWQKQQGEASK